MNVRRMIILLMMMLKTPPGGGLSVKDFLEGNSLAPKFKVKHVYGGLDNIGINILGLDDLENIGIPNDQIKGYLASFNFNLIMNLKNTKDVIYELKQSMDEITVDKEENILQCGISNLMELFNIIDLEINEYIDSRNRKRRMLQEHELAAQDATGAMAAFKISDQGKVNEYYNKVLDVINSCKGYYIYHFILTLKTICADARDMDISSVLINGHVNFENARVSFNNIAKICLGIDELGPLRSGTKRQTELEEEECKRHKDNTTPPLAVNDNDSNTDSDNDEEGREDMGNDNDNEDRESSGEGGNSDNNLGLGINDLDNNIGLEEDNESHVSDLQGSINEDFGDNILDRTEYLTTHTITDTTTYLTTHTESFTTKYNTVFTDTIYFITDKSYSTEYETETKTITEDSYSTVYETVKTTVTSTPIFIADTITRTPTKIAAAVTSTPTYFAPASTSTETHTADYTHYITPTSTVTAEIVTIFGPTVYLTSTSEVTITPTVNLPAITNQIVIQSTIRLDPTTEQVTNTEHFTKTETVGTYTSYETTEQKLKTTVYDSTDYIPWTTSYLSTETISISTYYLSTSTEIKTSTVTMYESITVRPDLEITNNNILPATTAQLKFNQVKDISLNALLRKIYSQYSENNLPYMKIVNWAKRIEKEAHDILNQLKLFKAQSDGVLLYNPFAKCKGMDKDAVLIKYNNNLFVAKKKYNDFVYYKSPIFCMDYCLRLISPPYVGDTFPPGQLFPAFGYSATKNQIVIREKLVESLDPCLSDKVNSEDCEYERVDRKKVTLLLGNLKQKCPENDICTYKDEMENHVASQMITSQDFKNYYLSNFIKLVDKIETASTDQTKSQYIVTAVFFGANFLIFVMVILCRMGFKKLKRKKRVRLVRFLSKVNLETEPLQEEEMIEFENSSTRTRERRAKAILQNLDQISSR